MLKKFPVLALCLLALLTPWARAEEAGAASVETFEDHLDTVEDVRRYEFEMAEDGDAVLYIAGLQESWDGYAYHWWCTVYEADMTTVVACTNVSGYTNPDSYSFPSVITADLDAGTYYIQMESTSSANPLMTTFTSDPYSITLVKAYHSASVGYSGGGVQSFQNAGDILWAFDGTSFVKLNDGACFMALMDSADGAVVPVLLGTDEASVEYVVSSTGKKIDAAGPWRDEESGTDYYYSERLYVRQYTERAIDTSSLPAAYFQTHRIGEAAGMICDFRRAEAQKKEEPPQAEPAEKASWISEHKGLIGVFAVVIAGGFILAVAAANRSGEQMAGESGTVRSYSSYSAKGSYTGGTSFNAGEYVQRTCPGRIYGVVTDRDLAAIDGDPSLTYAEREAAKSELKRQSDIYY